MINGSRVLGPVLVAALTLGGVSTAQIFLINAATYLFVVVALLKVHVPRPPHIDHEPGWRQFTAGLRLARGSAVSSRLLLSLTLFSFVSLPYVGLFPAVAKLNFGIVGRSAQYNWLYATWGLGAALGGLAVGTVFVGYDKRRLIRRGFAAFAICLAAFAVARQPSSAFVIGFFLGIAYFVTTTSMLTVMQGRLADNERGRLMSLWFMAFGGTVPLGNLVFGPVVDAIGARWVLLAGAVCAAGLAWWCDIAAIDHSTGYQEDSHLLQPGHAAAFDQHGVVARD
jgi:predicted MFS family arabinose efflux permease